MAVLMALLCTVTPMAVVPVSADEAVLLGDVDGNGSINSTDARLVRQYAVGIIDGESLDLAAADVNRDGAVTMQDACQILLYYAGKILEFESVTDGGGLPEGLLSLTVESTDDGTPCAVIRYETTAQLQCGEFLITYPTYYAMPVQDEQNPISSSLPNVEINSQAAADGELRVGFMAADATQVPESGILLSIPFTFEPQVSDAENDLSFYVQVEELVVSDDTGSTAYTGGEFELSLIDFIPYIPMLGDVDGDGTITSTDARMIKQYVVGVISNFPIDGDDDDTHAAADVNRDGAVTMQDACQILLYYAGKIREFETVTDGGDMPEGLLSLTVEESADDGTLCAVIRYETTAQLQCGEFLVTYSTDLITPLPDEENGFRIESPMSTSLPNAEINSQMSAEGVVRVGFTTTDCEQAPKSGVLLSIPFTFVENATGTETSFSFHVQAEELVTWDDTTRETGCAYAGGEFELSLIDFIPGWRLEQGYFYEVNSDNASVTVVGALPTYTDLRIPSSLNNKPVTAIGDSAFAGRTTLQEVTVPETVTAIGDEAFAGCTALEVVTLPEGLLTIGDGVFENDRMLVTAKLPTTLTDLGDRAFAGCSRLSQIVIPAGMTELGSDVIANSGVSLVVFNGSRERWNTLVKNSEDYRTAAVLFTVLSQNGVSVGYENGNTFNVNVSLSVDTVKNEEILDCLAEFFKKSVMDISLIENGEAVQPDSTVNVELPIPEDMQGEDCYVVHVDARGNVEVIEAERNGNSMNFKTDHFSVYAVVAGKATPGDADKVTLGDVNGSGKIDSTDARLVLQYAVKKIDASALNLAAANVDGKNGVDSTDARLILQRAVGKITQFPL